MFPTAKPLQKLSWSEKTKNNYQWFKDNIEWCLQTSHFHSPMGTGDRQNVILGLYNIYNSRFPSSWFTHVMNPYSTENKDYQNWGAKVRPQNIIRPNIEFLRGEYPKRPFPYSVVVRGEQGYNNFLEARKKRVFQNLSQHFINSVNDAMGGSQSTDPQTDATPPTGVDNQQVPMPDELSNEFANGYKDLIASQAQTDLDLIMEEQKIRDKLQDILKDMLICGEGRSYKGVLRDKVFYHRVKPLELAYDKAPGERFIKDGSWVCRRQFWTVPDIIDRFYDSISPGDIDDIEKMSAISSPASLYNYLENQTYQYNKVPVYHCQWKSMQKIGLLSGTDPFTGEIYNDIVGEDYQVDPTMGETIEWDWVVQVLEGWKVGDNIYTEMGPPEYQPNQINDYSKHELSYNGYNFSDDHAENISVAKLGVPFQIMYCILSIVMERTITKSKGKIALIDQNAIPYSKDGWDEEKFIYFAEAHGWALLDRAQVGVDKSWNQYQVLDLSTFQHVSELIKLMDWVKAQYDDQLGINRQAKGLTAPSDDVGSNRDAIFQSSVITEMIFQDFDRFRVSEIQGLINCSQIANRTGKRAMYETDDARAELLDINPDYYCYEELGIFAQDSGRENDALKRIRAYAQSFAQNGYSASAIVEIELADNISKLKGILKQIEAKQQEIQAQQAQSEHEQEVEKIQLEQQFKEYESLLDTEKMNQEYSRKEELVILQGDINLAIQEVANGMNPDTTGGADINEIMARANERDQMFQQKRMHDTTESNKMAIEKAKITLEEKKLATKNKEIDSKERTAKHKAKMDLAIARAKPKPSSGKK